MPCRPTKMEGSAGAGDPIDAPLRFLLGEEDRWPEQQDRDQRYREFVRAALRERAAADGVRPCAGPVVAGRRGRRCRIRRCAFGNSSIRSGRGRTLRPGRSPSPARWSRPTVRSAGGRGVCFNDEVLERISQNIPRGGDSNRDERLSALMECVSALKRCQPGVAAFWFVPATNESRTLPATWGRRRPQRGWRCIASAGHCSSAYGSGFTRRANGERQFRSTTRTVRPHHEFAVDAANGELTSDNWARFERLLSESDEACRLYYEYIEESHLLETLFDASAAEEPASRDRSARALSSPRSPLSPPHSTLRLFSAVPHL